MPTLNRRSFLQSLTAAGLVPALPALPAMAVPATAAHTSIQYTWACYYAQMSNACSVSQITSALGVRPEVGQGLFDRLVTQNIITAPGLSGVSVSHRRQMMNLRSGGAVTSKSTIQFDYDQLMAEITRDIDDQYPFTPAPSADRSSSYPQQTSPRSAPAPSRT